MADRRRPDRHAAYVQDIVDSCKAIEAYTRGKTLGEFKADAMMQDAVARRLSIVGEGAKCLSEEFRAKLPAIDWKNISRLRDKLGHHYRAIEVEKIWDVVVTHVAVLRESLEKHSVLE